MGKIDYQAIYARNKHGWYDMTEDPQRYEALLAGHYSDSNHFVYELLQNAEDARASKVVIEYYGDKLVFYHDGKPFDENDVKGVSSMLMGTKDRNDASTIGRFGMGFKSVFKYTYQPEIYSDDEAFRIESYLLPVEMPGAWDFREEKIVLSYELENGSYYHPFVRAKHLTKFVIPFVKKDYNGNLVSVSGKEVCHKLSSLNGEILLFLTHIKSLYWVDKTTDHYARINLEKVDNDEHLITCRVEGTNFSGKEQINRYLKYKHVFDHTEMANAEVSVAYKVNSRANNINEIQGSDICVYFPTRDNTTLPFLIHGSFETAVSREKLMKPSKFNSDLFEQLGNLIADSLEDLKKREMITQVFIRRILLQAFRDEQINKTIPGLKEKVTEKFARTALLPSIHGEYKNVDELHIAIPFGMTDFCDSLLFRESFRKANNFVAFNNEKEANFTEYFNWLINDLDIKMFTLENWANGLIESGEQDVDRAEMNDLNLCYAFLSSHREALYTSNLSYTRSGAYERMIKNIIPRAWKLLRKAPIILNGEQRLVVAYKDGEANIYRGSTSKYKSVVNSALVNHIMAKEFSHLFEEGFQIAEFNNYQFIKEKVIKKYASDDENVMFEDENHYEDEYVEDMKQIIAYMDETHDIAGMQELVKDAYIIKIKSSTDEEIFSKPCEVHADVSDEGVDLNVYYAEIPYDRDNLTENQEHSLWSLANTYSYNTDMRWSVDTEFYEQHGIAIKKLQQLGLLTSPMIEGTRVSEGIGDKYWIALGDYCPNIGFDGLLDNLIYIQLHSEEELAKQKSAEIMKLLLYYTNKFKGGIRYRKTSQRIESSEASLLKDYVRKFSWVITKDGSVMRICEISKHDLDTSIYGELLPAKEKYEILGFKETEADSKADTFELVETLNKRDKKILLNQLAKELGMCVSEATDVQEGEEDTFNPLEWESTEFPIRRVRNMESLIYHVREQFFCADPIKYEPVLRKIRVTKPKKIVQTYVQGMYTNDSNVKICQMCKKPSEYVDATEIANYDIELPQLNLCLCRNCSGKYKNIREANKPEFKVRMKNAIKQIDLHDGSTEFEIGLNSETSIFFTQTHLAELKAVFNLLDEFGMPSECVADKEENEMVEHSFHNATHTETRKPRVVDFPEKSKVKHKKYGKGTVIENDGRLIKVAFDNGSESTLDIKTCKNLGILVVIG